MTEILIPPHGYVRYIDHLGTDSRIVEAARVAYKSPSKGEEQARFVLPVGIYTEIYVNCDLHNLLNFLRLRQDGHAQSEIQDVANAMRAVAEPLFPWTFEAFAKYKFTLTENV